MVCDKDEVSKLFVQSVYSLKIIVFIKITVLW